MITPTIPSELESRIELVETCSACPEQYDMLVDGQNVGYFRLRHGHYRVENAEMTTTYYTAEPDGDGCFDPEERNFFLTMGKIAVLVAMGLMENEGPLPTKIP